MKLSKIRSVITLLIVSVISCSNVQSANLDIPLNLEDKKESSELIDSSLSLDLNSQEDKTFSYNNYKKQWDISGYVKLLGSFPTDNSPSEIEVDDLSVFISGNVNKWLNPFVEAEYFSGTLWQSQGDKNFSDGQFIFERLYNDFKISPNQQIRVGKFLAPVGFWNLTHAAPLVWSINRPVSSTYSYSNYITGVEYGVMQDPISGSRFDIYFQFGNEFDPKPLSKHPRRYGEIIGGSWTISDSLDSRSSLDFQYAKVKTSKSKRITVSYQNIWYLQNWDVDSQLIYTHINANSIDNDIFADESESDDAQLGENGWDGGGYLQARYRFNKHWNVYGRGEYFHFAIEKKSGNSLILGARYRMEKWGNINLEYKQGNGAEHILGDGFSISYNAMFRW